MDDIVKDDRFKHIVKDPRFKTMPRKDRKFKVDKRFKQMFGDKKFKLKYTVDKRGREIDLTSNENLKKFYDLKSDESESEEENETNKEDRSKKNTEKNIKSLFHGESKEENSFINDEKSEEEEDEDDDVKSETKSEASSDSTTDDELLPLDEQEAQIEEIPFGELDKDAIRSEDTSRRLAVCNMDWDRIHAKDLFVLFNSFKPSNGSILSIKIYPSEFGLKRLAEEEMHGPIELRDEMEQKGFDEEVEKNDKEEEEFDDDEEGDKFDRRKLRKYQFNRLKYYYAIVECDTIETACKIYDECDGLEYESSCTRLDLRFVPDDTTFEHEPKEVCTEAPDPLLFKPNIFFTTALNQTKVECTWDETPRNRLALTMKKYTADELQKYNFKDILATSSEEEEEDVNVISKEKKIEKSSKEEETDDENEDKKLEKYRKLLLGDDIDGKSKKLPKMEIDWDGNMEEEGFNELLTKHNKKSKKKKQKKQEELTEEEKKERAKLALLTMDDEDDKAHFKLDDLLEKSNKKKKRKKNEDEDTSSKRKDDFKIDFSDNRFEAIYTDHNFNIDPSNQQFKKTKLMEELMNEKLKRKETQKEDEPQTDKVKDDNETNKPTNDASVSLLVKSIKSKTEVMKRVKNDKNRLLLNKK